MIAERCLTVLRSFLPMATFRRPSDWMLDWVGGSKTHAGVRVDHTGAMSLDTVYRAINLISGDVAKLPLPVYRRQGDNSRSRDPRHPAYRLLTRKANDNLTAHTLKQVLTGHCLLHGNGYALIERDMLQRPIGLYLLDPQATVPEVVDGRMYYRTIVGDRTAQFGAEDVLHIKGLGYDGLVGYSVLHLARETFGYAIGLRAFGSTYFANGSRGTGVLTHPGKLTDTAAERLQKSFHAATGGLENAAKTILLEEGTRYTQLTIPNNEAQFLESRQFAIREVANWFGVPPHKLGDTTRTAYASIEQENKAYLEESLDRWLVLWEQECWDKLLSEPEKDIDSHFFEFIRAAFQQADKKTEAETLVYEVTHGLLTLNEVRDILNMPRYTDETLQADLPRLPLNIGVPGDEKPAPEPEGDGDEDDDGDGDDGRAVARRLLADAVRRPVVRLGAQVQRAARKPQGYLARLDELVAECHGLTAELAPAVEAARALGLAVPDDLAKRLLARLHHEAVEAAGRATADQLESEVEAVVRRLEGTLPAEIMGATNEN